MASKPFWAAPFTWLSPRLFGELVAVLRREGVDAVRKGRRWSLPLEDWALLVAAYWRTNLTMRQLAPLFRSVRVDGGPDHRPPRADARCLRTSGEAPAGPCAAFPSSPRGSCSEVAASSRYWTRNDSMRRPSGSWSSPSRTRGERAVAAYQDLLYGHCPSPAVPCQGGDRGDLCWGFDQHDHPSLTQRVVGRAGPGGTTAGRP
jgi:hypothetical protein